MSTARDAQTILQVRVLSKEKRVFSERATRFKIALSLRFPQQFIRICLNLESPNLVVLCLPKCTVCNTSISEMRPHGLCHGRAIREKHDHMQHASLLLNDSTQATNNSINRGGKETIRKTYLSPTYHYYCYVSPPCQCVVLASSLTS